MPFTNSFMQPVVEEATYYEVETRNGTEYVPMSVCGQINGVYMGYVYHVDDDEPAINLDDVAAHLRDYIEDGNIISIEKKHGFLARMSAPGYMDCTAWSTHETEAEAMAYLEEMYGEEDEGEQTEVRVRFTLRGGDDVIDELEHFLRNACFTDDGVIKSFTIEDDDPSKSTEAKPIVAMSDAEFEAYAKRQSR